MAADFAKADQQQQPQQQDNPLGEALDKFAGFAEPVTPLKTQAVCASVRCHAVLHCYCYCFT